LDAILRSHGPFAISYTSNDTFDIALQVSRNLHQYFGADSHLVKPEDRSSFPGSGNLITIAVGDTLPLSKIDFSIKLSPKTERLMIMNSEGYWETPGGSKSPLGAIFLRPHDEERLELVVWGSSLSMAQQAARLVPMMTGTGQADFILLKDDAKSRGADACYMGFFNEWWKVTKSSVLT
jgi:hypothetical protein